MEIVKAIGMISRQFQTTRHASMVVEESFAEAMPTHSKARIGESS